MHKALNQRDAVDILEKQNLSALWIAMKHKYKDLRTTLRREKIFRVANHNIGYKRIDSKTIRTGKEKWEEKQVHGYFTIMFTFGRIPLGKV